MASALTAILQSNVCDHPEKDALLSEARDIAAGLAVVRYTDVVPRDLEAEAHAREHLQEDDPMDENEELSEKRKMEGLEDMLSRLTAGAPIADAAQRSRPTMDDVRLLEGRLHALSARLGIHVDRS
ncbi:hypothetical protein R3P38DRAFT_2931735 [Favolaschia claudopus]|uniref:Uncharacterized protein n=1 Tax=Favolaschia claudopus TaxID=2862362 RepID=A0AAW0BX26_9AGAR